MRKLNMIAAPAILAALALGAASPLMAQQRAYQGVANNHSDHRTPNRAEAIRHQIEELERRVARNDNRDRISEREARELRRDVRQLRETFRVYNRNGLSNPEMRALNNRIANIRTRLRIDRNDRDNHRM